tara:strand:+ start:647 stop:931 length:285 start_codon:yes stop_codon:yes gene_type:complete
MNDVELYTNLHTSELIKVYRNMLKEKKLYASKHNDGYGYNKSQPLGLKRPKIEGEIMSWANFYRLPKAAIIVHIYMDGVNPEYLRKTLGLGEEE